MTGFFKKGTPDHMDTKDKVLSLIGNLLWFTTACLPRKAEDWYRILLIYLTIKQMFLGFWGVCEKTWEIFLESIR